MEMAEKLEVSVRTLRNWKQLDPAGERPRSGRPALPQVVREQDLLDVEAELERVGWSAGEETVWEGLHRDRSRPRVRVALKSLKAGKRQRRCAAQEAARTTVKVHARDVMWCVDATHLGRDVMGRAVQAEVLRDVASGAALRISLGYAATAAEVIQVLERAALERGCFPLVIVHDNGPPYVAREMREWCAAHGVLQLINLPHTPQHNPVAERGMRDPKEDSGLGSEVVRDIVEVRDRLAASVERMDGARRRPSKGGMTAREMDAALPSWRGLVERADIYRAATCEMKRTVLDSKTKRGQRVAIREAILSTLERLELITRTRGPRC